MNFYWVLLCDFKRFLIFVRDSMIKKMNENFETFENENYCECINLKNLKITNFVSFLVYFMLQFLVTSWMVGCFVFFFWFLIILLIGSGLLLCLAFIFIHFDSWFYLRLICGAISLNTIRWLLLMLYNQSFK